MTNSSPISLKRLLSVSGVKPSSFFIPGFFLMILAGAFIFDRGVFQRREERLRREAQSQRRQREIIQEAAAQRVGEAIADRAMDALRDIRFLQSYSSGWSGALKLPVGLEGSVSGMLSLAERQRSLPEIVESYRSFVRLLSERNTVIIGIDELDKMESAEVAERFLNDVKSIFGLDHCFYLVSVSENAISNFERRGLAFRDTFDSCFDAIIYVDYLSLEDSKRLLRRRVIGLEVPFICLCHCISGGLPRDLVRACREMLDSARGQTDITLKRICQTLVLHDVRGKLRAMTFAAKKNGVEPDTSDFLGEIRKLEESLGDADLFLKARSSLPAAKGEVGRLGQNENDESRQRMQINSLKIELRTYLYFAATVIDFFSRELSKQDFINAESSGHFDLLARARQFCGVNPFLAISTLEEFQTLTLNNA